jgi:DNA sulfur modification protein DndD
LRDIETIFIDTKEKKFDEFIKKLQIKSNKFIQLINVDSFIGEISIYKKTSLGKTVVEVQLLQNGKPFYKPNESLETSMYISILFAISELAFETKDEYYPLIFDAPTSSFGDYKTAQFLNLVYETENQKILLTKNFLDRDKATKKLFIKKEFESIKRDKAFWVKLEEPFDKNDLTTINTQVINL